MTLIKNYYLRSRTITCSIEELTNRKCKWPFGDPQHDDFEFCGAKAPNEANPYCDEHMEKAFRKGYVSKRERLKNKEIKDKLAKKAA